MFTSFCLMYNNIYRNIYDLKFDIMNKYYVSLYTLVFSLLCIFYKSQNYQHDLLESVISSVIYVFLGFKFSSGTDYLFLLYNLPSTTERVYLYPDINFNEELKKFLLQCFYIFINFVIIFLSLCYILKKNVYMELLSASVILIGMLINRWISNPDKREILEKNELNIGYGAALSYYKNYLEFFLPEKFIERIQTFKSYNKVDVENKLFILVPESCRVHKYIDNSDTIERCQELPKLCINHGGVKDRIYNITVYLINCKRNNNNCKNVRMAVEYAQPLKGLYNLMERRIISEEEMYRERKCFVKCLKEFLRDKNDSFKFCVIVEFDDRKIEVVEALLESRNSYVYSETV